MFINSYYIDFNFDYSWLSNHFKINKKLLISVYNILNLSIIIFFFVIIFLFYINNENRTTTKRVIKCFLYILNRILTEVEKELINFDDTYMLILIFFIVFGWFFLLYLCPFNINENIFGYVLVALPFMCILTFTIPLFILYDQGMFFLTYLRGTSSTTIFILEIIYDYLSILIMFIRIIIQNLRFIFMFLVYFELQEHVIYINENDILPYPDLFLGEAGKYLLLPRTIKWYIKYKLPFLFICTIYYICHLYVIIISNTLAYVFLVFWLYLLFYSCFYTRKFENFFKNRYNKY